MFKYQQEGFWTMGAEDEMVFAAEKQSGSQTRLLIGIAVILIVGAVLFFFLTSPKQTGFFGLKNPIPISDSTDNQNSDSTSQANWLEDLNPFKPTDTVEDETFKDIPLQADWTVQEHELYVSDVTLTIQGNASIEDSVSKKELTSSEATLQHFDGSIKLTSSGLVLSGTILEIQTGDSKTVYTNPESVIITGGQIKATDLVLDSFNGNVTGSFTFPNASIQVDSEPIEFKGFKGTVELSSTRMILNGQVDSFKTSTKSGTISVK